MKHMLQETLSSTQSRVVLESKDDFDLSGKPAGKSLYMKGIFIQGGIRNANQRVYPVSEIERAVKQVTQQLSEGYSVVGQLDHPPNLEISLDRVSHAIEEMWMEGPNGYGKLKILPTPMGQLAQVMLESGVKLGVSSRGAGNVKEDGSGEVSGFEIITVDIVAQPSAPGAYPIAIYEGLMNANGGYRAIQLAQEIHGDRNAQRYIKESLMGFIRDLK